MIRASSTRLRGAATYLLNSALRMNTSGTSSSSETTTTLAARSRSTGASIVRSASLRSAPTSSSVAPIAARTSPQAARSASAMRARSDTDHSPSICATVAINSRVANGFVT